MPKHPPNRLPLSVPKRYFELCRGGLKGAAAARHVGVSTSAGSVWFIKAGRMLLPDRPIDERYLSQDDRITIAQGLLAGRTASAIAGGIGKHRSTVYREVSRGRGPNGTYNPWWSHNQAILRRRFGSCKVSESSSALSSAGCSGVVIGVSIPPRFVLATPMVGCSGRVAAIEGPVDGGGVGRGPL
ncbi:helix-turn-helix domain-containing protein [Streptomyces sp. NPDC052207]|uniref:helix-turn-helix domain-containing protein n=1 Tax=Streptomyces sp. NPDC052207 TaxID=3155418 RepID=UPI0034252B31